MSQWFNLEAALQTNGATKNDVKEVIKKNNKKKQKNRERSQT